MSLDSSDNHPGREPVHRKFRLSKSKLASFEHCAKRLWLQVHRRDLAVIDPRTEALFAAGHRLGELAREQVPNGILLDSDPLKVDEALEHTANLLKGPWIRPLFEPAFKLDDVIIRADILQPDGWGGWKLIEVKNSTAVRLYQLRDVATQAWVVRGSGLCVSNVIIRHSSRRLYSPMSRALPGPLIDVDVTSDLGNLIRDRPRVAQAARQVLRGPEPHRPAGPHCTQPFRCEFREYCSKGERAKKRN